MKKKYEVTRYYTCADVYLVYAENEKQAYEKACSHEYEWHKSYDSPEDDNHDVQELS